jgi:hypothetical protein
MSPFIGLIKKTITKSLIDELTQIDLRKMDLRIYYK